MRLLFCLAMVVMCTACAAEGPRVVLGGQTFGVEIADTTEKQVLGLMYRDSLPDDRGMLFVFANEAPRSFWMKNTRIPLDIMYFDRNLKMVSIAADTPPCKASPCRGYPSVLPAMYVLELNAGKASELGVGPGDSLIIKLD